MFDRYNRVDGQDKHMAIEMFSDFLSNTSQDIEKKKARHE